MGCSPVSLTVMVLAFATFSVMDFDQIVQHYLQVYVSGDKKVKRPT